MNRQDAPALRIDTHAHAFSREFLLQLAELERGDVRLQTHTDGRLIALWNKAPLPEFRLDERLAAMADDRVAIEILSAPPVYGRFGTNTARLCTLMNASQRALYERAPGRFYGFIHLPYHQREAAFAELDRWHGDPAFVGVTIASNVNGQYPDRSLDWLWEYVEARAWPVFVHPVAPHGVTSTISLPLVHFPSDTTVFAAHVILSGALERFVRLRFVLSHYGGSLNVLGGRLDMIRHPHFPPQLGHDLPHAPSSYVPRFYVDTAQGGSKPAYLAALAAFGEKHILFGSDYFLLDTPWRRELNVFLDEQLADTAARRAILHDNAAELFRLDTASTEAVSQRGTSLR